jgi:hypothetical protein
LGQLPRIKGKIEAGDLQIAFVKDKDPGFSEEIRSIRTGVHAVVHRFAAQGIAGHVLDSRAKARPRWRPILPWRWVRCAKCV